MASVELSAITKRFGAVEVITDLNLTVEDGSFCALLGPSGCGKSTMLRMIAGLESVSGGQISIGGRDVTHVEPKARGVAMVFQNYALYPHLTVAQNIAFSLSLAGESKARQHEAALAVAKTLQLDQLLDRRPAQLSGGQRQRVAIGRALVRDPQVFLFDEPLSNLDALLRGQMRLELARLHADLKRTMIYVTHDQVEAMTLADKIVVLDRGRISQAGSPWELYNNPANRFVAGFIGSPAMNFLRGTATSASAVALQGGAQVAVSPRQTGSGQPVELGIRPDEIRVSAPGQGQFDGRATIVEYLGNTSHAFVESSEGPIVVELPKETKLEQGSAVGLTIDPARAHLFDDRGLAIPRA
ncbi:MAG: sn-glycerol-3-phosphate transporter ATP-binding protein UgpC [Pseudomonadota bacterium]